MIQANKGGALQSNPMIADGRPMPTPMPMEGKLRMALERNGRHFERVSLAAAKVGHLFALSDSTWRRSPLKPMPPNLCSGLSGRHVFASTPAIKSRAREGPKRPFHAAGLHVLRGALTASGSASGSAPTRTAQALEPSIPSEN